MPMFLRTLRTGFLFWMLTLALTVSSRAQTSTGEISGVVVDPSGSAGPGGTITLESGAANAVREVQTNSPGLYVIPAIPPGIYTLKAHISGFRMMQRRDIEVQVGS